MRGRESPMLEKRSNPTMTCKGLSSCRWDVEVSPNVLLFILFNSETCLYDTEYIRFIMVWILRCFWYEIIYCWILGDRHYRTASFIGEILSLEHCIYASLNLQACQYFLLSLLFTLNVYTFLVVVYMVVVFWVLLSEFILLFSYFLKLLQQWLFWPSMEATPKFVRNILPHRHTIRWRTNSLILYL